MPLEILAASSLISALTGLVGKASYDCLKAKYLEAIKDYTEIDLNPFYIAVFQCVEKASFEVGIDLTSPWADWSNSRIRQILESQQDIDQKPQYLPDYPPIVKLKQIIAEQVIIATNDNNKERDFIVCLNQKISSLADRADLQPILRNFSRIATDKQLQKHLEQVRSEELFRLSPESLPLKDAYIAPRGVFCKADGWQSVIKEDEKDSLFEGDIKCAKALLNEYFDGGKYSKDPYNPLPVLFVGADFGIGKSSFARIMVSQLAKEWLHRQDGFIPVYFPLKKCAESIGNISNHLKSLQLLRTDGPKIALFLDGLDESGKVTHDHVSLIFSHLQDLKINLPSNSRIIITSRLVLGPNGRIAEFIRSVLGGVYLRLVGLDPTEVTLWYEKQAQDSANEAWAKGMSVEKIEELGLSSDEWCKPLYLWMIGLLLKNSEITHKSTHPFSGRTGLYMRLMDMISREAKPKIANDYQTENCTKEKSSILEHKARYLLQRLAVIRNQVNTHEGLDEKTINQSLSNHPEAQSYFEELSNTKFLALSYFGHNGDCFEFTHLSFKEYLLAEYILSTLIRAASKDDPELIRHLCVGYVSFEAASFLSSLCAELEIWLLDSNSISQFDHTEPFSTLLNTISLECRHLQYDISDCDKRKSFLERLLKYASTWIANDTLFVTSPSNTDLEQKRIFSYKVNSVQGPLDEHPWYTERALALLMGQSLSTRSQGPKFLNIFCKNLPPHGLADIIKCSKNFEWIESFLCSATLNDINLEGISLACANFYRCNLRNAKLNRVVLSMANLSKCSLVRTLCIGSIINEADLRFSNLSGANFSRSFFFRANISSSTLVKTKLIYSDFTEANLSKSNLLKANLYRANLFGANLSETNFKGANLQYADLSNAKTDNTSFENADLRFANLSGIDKKLCNFKGALLQG